MDPVCAAAIPAHQSSTVTATCESACFEKVHQIEAQLRLAEFKQNLPLP
jgi:hypothetical protein